MVMLTVMNAEDSADIHLATADFETAVAALDKQGVRLWTWPVKTLDVSSATGPDVLAAYEAEVAELSAQEGFNLVDCVKLNPPANSDDYAAYLAKGTAARATFRAEHNHAEDEVRFFAGGRSCFYLHLGDEVFAVVCEAGELLSVPAGTRHWFDMGPEPDFCAIRFFEREDGWVGSMTGDPIAKGFPELPELLASFAAA